MFAVVAGVLFASFDSDEYRLRWGGDWDMDGTTTDQSLWIGDTLKW